MFFFFFFYSFYLGGGGGGGLDENYILNLYILIRTGMKFEIFQVKLSYKFFRDFNEHCCSWCHQVLQRNCRRMRRQGLWLRRC